MVRPLRWVLVWMMVVGVRWGWADTPAQKEVAGEMSKAASALLASLDDQQKAKISFEMSNDKERHNWHFIPRDRKGLTWKEMQPAQQRLAFSLLVSGLSSRGYASAVQIMSLEQILLDMEKGKGPRRDPENYAVSIFGTPDAAGSWGWRVEGHHLSLNFTIADGMLVAAGPVFFGTNPAEIRQGPRKGLRVLDKEEDLGFALIHLLTDEQRKAAVIQTKAPNEIITGNSAKARLEPVGVAFSALSEPQKQLLQLLVKTYAQRLRVDLAEQDLSAIEKAGWDKVQFAWAGAMEAGEGHYYRLQGPTFLVEFDNTQNNANHIHTVWRDLQNDFGEDILKEHYEQDHKPAK